MTRPVQADDEQFNEIRVAAQLEPEVRTPAKRSMSRRGHSKVARGPYQRSKADVEKGSKNPSIAREPAVRLRRLESLNGDSLKGPVWRPSNANAVLDLEVCVVLIVSDLPCDHRMPLDSRVQVLKKGLFDRFFQLER